MVFLKEFFEKVDLEKNQQTTKNIKKTPKGAKSKQEGHEALGRSSESWFMVAILFSGAESFMQFLLWHYEKYFCNYIKLS